jgi:long-subunit acyl-CoA synthetase (AMP-forming)
LTDAPSVATGDLTPNMKLRRPVVLRRFADAIDALYGDSRVPTGVDVGEAPRERVAA